MNLKVGDWVSSYSAGIWQIYRILSYKCLDPISKQETIKTSVFSKRFLSNSFKRSFKEECCSPEIVQKLDNETQTKLQKFIEENSSLYQKFVEFKPKSLSRVYNARIGIPKSKSTNELEDQFSKEQKFNELQIKPYLEKLGFNTNEMPSWTAQFISENHEVEDGYLVYKFTRVLEF